MDTVNIKNEEKAMPTPGDLQTTEREIDFTEVIRFVWKERKFFMKICAIAVVSGLMIAFSIPKEYTTTVKLAPETKDESKKMSGLGGLAAIAGINLNSSVGSDAISPELYPDVVQSTPFLLELFAERIPYKQTGDSLTLYDYMAEHQKIAWWNYLLKAPFTTIAFLKDFFEESSGAPTEINPFQLTRDQEEVVKALRERILVSVDKKTFVVTVSVEMQQAIASAKLAQIVVEKLQNYITEYRTYKAKDDLQFTQKVYTEAKEAYYKAQQMYATFEDANRNIVSSSYRTEQERLKNEMTLTFNVYNTLAQKLEQDKLRVQEQTPVYTVIEPATVPLKASSPKKIWILICTLVLELLGGVAYILINEKFLREKSNLQKRNTSF